MSQEKFIKIKVDINELEIRKILELIKFFFFFGCAHDIWKFLGHGSNPGHSSDPSHSSDNSGSLTRQTTRKLPIKIIFKNPS